MPSLRKKTCRVEHRRVQAPAADPQCAASDGEPAIPMNPPNALHGWGYGEVGQLRYRDPGRYLLVVPAPESTVKWVPRLARQCWVACGESEYPPRGGGDLG